MAVESESDTSSRLKKFYKHVGMRLYRNTVGAYRTKWGGWIRYGLAPGTSDRIGWTTVTITQEMLGRKLAVFTAIEEKRPKKKGQAAGKVQDNQADFIEEVKQAGGIAGKASCEEDVLTILKDYGIPSPILL